MNADMIGWIGNIFYISGAIFIAIKKPVLGQFLNVIGGVAYAAQGFIAGLSSLLVIEIFLVIINLFGVFNWKIKDEEKERVKKEWFKCFLKMMQKKWLKDICKEEAKWNP